MTSRALASLVLAAGGALICTAVASAQDAQGSRVETVQIGDQRERRGDDEVAGKAYLGPAPVAPTARKPRTDIDGTQIARPDDSPDTLQISTGSGKNSSMPQLSQAELEARLSQLTPSERRVLLEAIEGTDICDNPPEIDTIRALCRNRIEARVSDFAGPATRPVSAEERLLRGGVDESGTPNVERVIERLARTTATADDFDNQAIASIALTPPPGPPVDKEDGEALGNLPSGTEAVINAIVNQLGGAGGP